jgi:rhamnosyltransferase
LKIAILGCRGIPAKYGGFETFAQGLTENLVEEGYEVTVSCEYEESKSRQDDYKGAKLDYFPIKPPNNYFLRKIYENLSDIYFLIKLSRSQNLIYFLGIEVGMFLFIPKILNRKSKILVNIDGVMWKRSKFNIMERWLLKINHELAILFADIVIIDSEEMKNYVNDKYWNKTVYISYGINKPDRMLWSKDFSEQLKKLTSTDITSGNYYLVVARLEPENNIHIIVEAFIQAKLNIPLLIVGDFTDEHYKEEINSIVKNSHSTNVFFLGSIYDQELLNMLRQNCIAYIHGHSVGGTNPSLLEANVSRNIIIAHDNLFNREVCGKSAVYFKNITELTENLNLVYKHPENYLNLKEEAYRRVLNDYSWERITGSYVSLLNKLHLEDDKEFIKNYEKRKHVFQEFAKNYTINKNSTYKRDNWGKE